MKYSLVVLTWNVTNKNTKKDLLKRHEERREIIRRCVPRLRTHAGFEHEIVIVSSGDEGHDELVRSWHSELLIEHVCYIGKRIGVCGSRAVGYAKTSGDIVGFIDDDVLVEDDYLLNLDRFLKKHAIAIDRTYLTLVPCTGGRIKESDEYRLSTKGHDGSMFISRALYDSSCGYELIAKEHPYQWEPLKESLASVGSGPIWTPKPWLATHMVKQRLRRLWVPEWGTHGGVWPPNEHDEIERYD